MGPDVPVSPARWADVVRVDFGACVVRLADDTLVRAVVRGRLMGERKSLGNAVVVGDHVRWEPGQRGGAPVITDVEPRRNAFSRRAPGRQAAEQVMAANVDQVVLVSALDQPAFSPGLADRVFCQAERAGIPARHVLNKSDLAGDSRDLARRVDEILSDYAHAGYPGHAASARTGAGLDQVRDACRNRRSLFVGHSGVGKSTLLNALIPGLDLLVGEVNAKTGRGRHTTTAAWLLKTSTGFEVVDTPGVRAFGLWGIEPEALADAYPEFRPCLRQCRFADCGHVTEPGCALRAAVEAQRISPRRYASFLRLREELTSDLGRESLRPGG